jgi:hypothetical protein
MTQDEIIDMAQECNLIGMRPHLDGIYAEALEAFAKLVAAKALAQPEQEPVACGTYQEVTDTMNGLWAGTLEQVQIAEEMKNKKLYTTPPQRPWVGLTNNDLQPIAEEYRILFGSWVHDFARAIEAKLKEKNNA